MKQFQLYKYCVPTALLIVITVLTAPLIFPVRAHDNSLSALSFVEPQSDAGAALSRGRTLLKQGHADQALGYLQNALSQYTQANNQRGMAAARDALGDLYMVQ